jgi:hypothetical protein
LARTFWFARRAVSAIRLAVDPLEDRAARRRRERAEVTLRVGVPGEGVGEVLRHVERVARVELRPRAVRLRGTSMTARPRAVIRPSAIRRSIRRLFTADHPRPGFLGPIQIR